MSEHAIVQCTLERHGAAILEIFNDAIEHSTALFDYQPRTMQTMTSWFEVKRAGGYPVIGIENDEGALMAFGSYGAFRPFPANKYTVEHSVYVNEKHRGKGLGLVVMHEIIAAARRNNLHALIGGITTTNVASIALHEKLGFKHVGTLPEVGFKFGGWLDLSFYQLLLETPLEPVDG